MLNEQRSEIRTHQAPEACVVDAVIFDLDGVLVHTDELHYLAWQRLADEEGIPFDRSVNDRLRGVSRMDSLAAILDHGACRHRYSDEQCIALATRKNEYYRAALRGLRPDDLADGSVELLRELRRRGVRMAIASSSRNAHTIVDRLRIRHHFDVVVGGTEIVRSKPDPEVFLITAAQLKVAPAQCVVIEDAPAGVEAALRAGMRVIGIGDAARLPDAEACFESIGCMPLDALVDPPLPRTRIPMPPRNPGNV